MFQKFRKSLVLRIDSQDRFYIKNSVQGYKLYINRSDPTFIATNTKAQKSID